MAYILFACNKCTIFNLIQQHSWQHSIKLTSLFVVMQLMLLFRCAGASHNFLLYYIHLTNSLRSKWHYIHSNQIAHTLISQTKPTNQPLTQKRIKKSKPTHFSASSCVLFGIGCLNCEYLVLFLHNSNFGSFSPLFVEIKTMIFLL